MLWCCSILTSLHAIQAALTLLPLSRSQAWWVRWLDFPRLQLAVMSAGLLIADLALLRWGGSWVVWLGVIAAAMLCYQAAWIFPYTPLYKKMVQDARPGADRDARIRILIVNVLMQNRSSKHLIEQIHRQDPDLLIVSEPDAWWQAQLDVFESDRPYTVKCPQSNCYGMLIYSKLPLHDVQVQYLVDDDVPSIHALVELRSGDAVQLHALHPRPPVPSDDQDSTARDAELVVVGRSVIDAPRPVIVAGDLNDVAWSATTKLFLRISRLLDPRVGRGMLNSFHAQHSLMRWPLDHLFHSKHFSLVELRRLEPFGSDHFPILVELALEPRAEREHEQPTPSADDHEQARQKLSEESVEPSDVHRPSRRSTPGTSKAGQAAALLTRVMPRLAAMS